MNQDAARLALRFKPNDTFEANLAFDYNRQRENGVPNVLVATYDGASLAAIGALAVIMLVSMKYEVPEVVTGFIGVAFIVLSVISSLRQRKLEAA